MGVVESSKMVKPQPHLQYPCKTSKEIRMMNIVFFTALEPTMIKIAATMELVMRASSSMLVMVSPKTKNTARAIL